MHNAAQWLPMYFQSTLKQTYADPFEVLNAHNEYLLVYRFQYLTTPVRMIRVQSLNHKSRVARSDKLMWF